MFKSSVYQALALCLMLLALTACVRQQGSPQEIEVFRQGSLQTDTEADIPQVVYVNVRDTSNRVLQAQGQIEKWLAATGFSLSQNPSQAGYIVQVTVLEAGPVQTEALRHAVQQGYDGPAQVAGEGGTGLLADVLLVQRRVPSSSRPSRVQLKNIADRNAVSSSQMRIALLIPHEMDLTAGLPPFFADRLAAELSTALRHTTGPADLPAAGKAATAADKADLTVTPQLNSTPAATGQKETAQSRSEKKKDQPRTKEQTTQKKAD